MLAPITGQKVEYDIRTYKSYRTHQVEIKIERILHSYI